MDTTFLGLGAMGSALAATTSAAGDVVTVWNRSAGRNRRMAGFGGHGTARLFESLRSTR